VPINDFAIANQELADENLEVYYTCCGKSVCAGCVHSFRAAGNNEKCPFCNSDRSGKTDEELVADMMKRVDANDAASICMLANYYEHGNGGLQQDHGKAIKLYTRAAELGYNKAHYRLAHIYHEGGNLKKAKFHFEAAAMAGHDGARNNLGYIEFKFGNMEQAIKHWTIAASAGYFGSMHEMRVLFEQGLVSRKSIDSTLAAYNNSCAEMRSEARDVVIHLETDTI
jgi:TPR repeat protein